MVTVYGIPNCDSCRAARKWLREHEVEHAFHDIRVDGLDARDIHRWADRIGWKSLLNTRSATWRKVPQGERDDIDGGRALTLMFEHPTLIKRPVLETGNQIHAGFSKADFARIFDASSSS